MANIVRLNFSPDACNTYILGKEGKPCLVFDVGQEAGERVLSYARKHHQGKILGIFITHGHFDHFGGLNEEDGFLNCPWFLPSEDLDAFFDPEFNVSPLLGLGEQKLREDHQPYPFEDEDEITLGESKIVCIHTPFHTQGSYCFYLPGEEALISGDTLFRLGVGRTDLRGARPRLMGESLDKLRKLPMGTKVYPGHGPLTTLEYEFAHNPYCAK